MKEFKVELVHIRKDYASVVLEAANKKEALEKARKLQAERFDVTDKSTIHEGKVRPVSSFYNTLASFFGG